MDEEQEDKQNGQTMADKAIDTASDTANAIKDGSNLAKDVATGNVLGGVKHTTNLLKNKTFRRALLIALSIPIIIVVALLFPVFTIFDGVGNKLREIGESAVDFFTVDNEGVIQITETEEMDIVNDTIKAIEDLGVTLDDLHLMGDVDYSDPEVEEKAKEALKKYIRKFYEAQAVTQTLYTNPGWFTEAILNNGKTYGKVFVYRTKGEDTVDETNSEPLRYRPYEEMQALQQSENLLEIKKYYSVNNGKLVVPEWTTTTINGVSWTEISLREVDYKNVISQYTVPAQFFVYLTITTKNPEFVAAFSDLVKDSEIRLTILDTNTVTTETQTYTYTEHEKGTEISQIQSQGQTIETPINRQDDKKQVTTTTVDTTVSTLKVTYVKTWCTEQSITYKKKSTGPIDDEPDIRDASNDPNLADEPEPSDPPKGTTVTWKTNQKRVIERTTSGYVYEEDNRGEVKDKTGEKGSQGLNANGKVDKNTTFLGLLDDKFKIPNTSDEEAAGHNNFVQNADWLFYLLEKDDSLQTLEQLMKFIYYKYTEDDRYGVTTFDFSIFEINDFQMISGGVSPFGTNLTREEFISLATAYSSSSDYVNYMLKYAGDFYDICTNHNINPALAYAHACLETGNGGSSACQNNKNYFGYAHGNDSNSGKKYNSVRESIEDYCQWIINNSTQGTNAYQANMQRAKEYATANSKLNGTPDKNIYVLYCRYAYLGDTHISDEPSFASPAGEEYYKSHGSNWGTGGRIYIYQMYEKGGLYTGEYSTRCGHSSGSDATTIAERADYAVYASNRRINIAKAIFGNNCLTGTSGSLIEAAYEVADYFMNSGVTVHYAGNSVPEATNNGRHVIGGNIQASWEKPLQEPNRYGVVCATYVAFSMWKAGLVDEATLNQYSYNSCRGLEKMLTTSSYANQWQKITNFNELQEGDIVFITGHVYFYMDGRKCLDQNYCVVQSNGKDTRGKLLNASADGFRAAYRYIGE